MEDCCLVLSRFLFATMPRTIPATHAATDGDGTIARATMDGPGQIPPSPQPAPNSCLLYTSPSPRDQRGSRMPSSA